MTLKKQTMNWYLVKLVYQIVSGKGNHHPQFDEQWRLIRADEISWAHEKASILGRIDSVEFLNSKVERVQWKFIGVVEVMEVSLTDGAQIYSATEEPVDVDAYLHNMNTKEMFLKDLSNKVEVVNL